MRGRGIDLCRYRLASSITDLKKASREARRGGHGHLGQKIDLHVAALSELHDSAQLFARARRRRAEISLGEIEGRLNRIRGG